MNGILETFNEYRGYGFIAPLVGRPGQTDHVYLHATAIKRGVDGRRQAIPEGAEVRFRLVRGKDGRPQAADVEMVELGAESLKQLTEQPATRRETSK